MAKLLLWWFSFSTVWGLYRLLGLPEFFSEVIAKPVVWLGFTFFYFRLKIIPEAVFFNLRHKFSKTEPFLKVFLLPILFVIAYFFLINFRQISFPTFSLSLLVITLVINFATGIVEEIVYRGVMYVWLLEKVGEVKAFLLVQILFLVGHLPVLMINSDSLTGALSHAFFIVLMGIVHTLIFRLTKSIFASSLTHGVWNSLVYYLLLS